jgi:flagellar L-ring protein precursor FlgH
MLPRVVLLALLLPLGQAARAQEVSEAEYRVAQRLQGAYGTENPLARPKASRLHDRVTILINEQTAARNEAVTELDRGSEMGWTLNKWFTLSVDEEGNLLAKPRLQENNDPGLSGQQAPNLDFLAERTHEGDGSTERTQTFQSQLTGEVLEVLPNGQLVVEARSTIRLNEEEQTLVFTGRVDPRDLDDTNTVDARYVIDKRIDFTGEGAITDMNRRGWGARLLDKLNPF